VEEQRGERSKYFLQGINMARPGTAGASMGERWESYLTLTLNFTAPSRRK
jgi:hypothetical protein